MRNMKTEDPKAMKSIPQVTGISTREVLPIVLAKIRPCLLNSIHEAEEAANPMDRLDALVRGYFRMLEANPGIPRLLRSNEINRPPFRQQAHIDFEGVLAWIQEQMEEAQGGKRIRQDADPALLALMLPGMLEALTTRWLLCDCSFSLGAAGEAAWQGFLVLVATRSFAQAVVKKNVNGGNPGTA